MQRSVGAVNLMVMMELRKYLIDLIHSSALGEEGREHQPGGLCGPDSLAHCLHARLR